MVVGLITQFGGRLATAHSSLLADSPELESSESFNTVAVDIIVVVVIIMAANAINAIVVIVDVFVIFNVFAVVVVISLDKRTTYLCLSFFHSFTFWT
jgi:hypothetical protein